jgi:hypothetical protein
VPDPNDADALNALAREHQARAARIRTYLADAFATYVMGPAYACACLLIKLDPTAVEEPEQNQGWDRVRAAVVLSTLDKISPPFQSHLSDIILTLRDSWETALTQLGPAQLDNRELGLVQPVVGRVVSALELIEAKTELPIVFDDAAWAEAMRLAGEYFGDLVPDTDPPTDSDPATSTDPPRFKTEMVTLPEVLNAAWYQRLQHPDPKMADAIAMRVRKSIWPYLKPPSAGGSTSRKRPLGDIRP